MDIIGTRKAVAQLAFTATDDSRWTVREYIGRGAGLNGDSACLIFEGDSVVRRIRAFPANWRELDPDALIALSWTV